ncbi:hypothetical protein F0562_022334 [Nyssa sinensis]|uniref:Reverse transcriptase domain-containing protein n=1 Tax=Nyssa sinensis TaxID=561372 RepID=A0A5J5BRC8_9ASTE|nr:hypothetical protein F0562_022334 [Nyssa sinensis]
MQRGLHQGDLISPFLFNIVAEGFNILLKGAKAFGHFKGSIVGVNGVNVSHIQFPNDTIIFYEAEWLEIINIKRILRRVEHYHFHFEHQNITPTPTPPHHLFGHQSPLFGHQGPLFYSLQKPQGSHSNREQHKEASVVRGATVTGFRFRVSGLGLCWKSES